LPARTKFNWQLVAIPWMVFHSLVASIMNLCNRYLPANSRFSKTSINEKIADALKVWILDRMVPVSTGVCIVMQVKYLKLFFQDLAGI
jgi:hypothetical protein